MFIFQIYSAFILILFSHYFNVVMCVLNWEINTPHISRVNELNVVLNYHISIYMYVKNLVYISTQRNLY